MYTNNQRLMAEINQPYAFDAWIMHIILVLKKTGAIIH